MLKIIEEVSAEMEVMKSHVLGHSDSVWDARTASVRTKESAIGNFVADLMRVDYGSDMALLQGGCIRSNAQYGEGAITFGDIMKMFPFVDSTVMFEIQGKYIWEALESGFSQWPKQEGRFPQLSGCKVVVDVSKQPGSRLVSVEIGDQPLDHERMYTVASKPYTMKGGDGYTALTNKTRVIVDEENGVSAANLIRNEFLTRKAAYALERERRVKSIINSALSAFSGTKVGEDGILLDKNINISVEGRITLQNVPEEH